MLNAGQEKPEIIKVIGCSKKLWIGKLSGGLGRIYAGKRMNIRQNIHGT